MNQQQQSFKTLKKSQTERNLYLLNEINKINKNNIILSDNRKSEFIKQSHFPKSQSKSSQFKTQFHFQTLQDYSLEFPTQIQALPAIKINMQQRKKPIFQQLKLGTQINQQTLRKTSSIKNFEVKQNYEQIILKNQINILNFDEDQFQCIEATPLIKVSNLSSNIQKNEIIILNFWGLIANKNLNFQDFNRQNKKYIINNYFQEFISILQTRYHIVIILQNKYELSNIVRFLSKLQINHIFIKKKINNLFTDYHQILKDFKDIEITNILLFDVIDSQIDQINGQFIIQQDKSCFTNKLPKLFFQNLSIIFFQNELYKPTNQDYLKNIIKISMSFNIIKNRNLYQIQNLDKIFDCCQNYLNTQRNTNNYLNDIQLIKITNKNKSKQEKINFKQQQMYNEFKEDAKKQNIKMFFWFIGNFYERNRKFKVWQESKKLLEVINDQMFDDFLIDQIESEKALFLCLQQNIFTYYEHK